MTTSAIDKRYMCVCYGQMQLSGVIEEPIARDSQSIITRKVDASGKYAKTSYETVMTNLKRVYVKLNYILEGRIKYAFILIM